MSDLLKTLFMEEEVIAPSDLMENIFSETVVQVEQTLKFRKMLISCVRKQPQLYDTTHEEFSNQEIKNIIWNKIAEKLNIEAEVCQEMWADLRYQYQRYVRRLRAFLRNENQDRKRRPVFALESEMLFLWRFITNKSLAPLPFKKGPIKPAKPTEKEEEDDDIVILDEEPVVIVLDDEDKKEESTVTKFKITAEMRKLIALVKGYPELYDSEHQYFNDYRRKGIIWNAIANEARDKATRLMKLWIQLQTRFEWEIWHNKNPFEEEDTNELRAVLKFMREAILKNPKTVYKQSLFLKLSWYDPIDHFKNIFNLIALLKKNLDVVNETEKKITPKKDTDYVATWTRLSQVRTPATTTQAGQLEATWLILRHFYWELMSMRQSSYQLQDKWYFESIITDMYAQAKLVAEPEPVETVPTPLPSPTAPTLIAQAPSVPRPISICQTPVANRPPLRALAPATTVLPTPAQNPTQQIFNAPSSQQSSIVMPKIVSAKSLAVPQVNPPKGLQIYQVMPQQAMTVIPPQQPMSTFPSNTTIRDQQQQQFFMAPQSNLTQVPQMLSPHNNTMTVPRIASVHTMATIANVPRQTSSAAPTMPQAPGQPRTLTSFTPTLATPTITSTSSGAYKIPATIVAVRPRMPTTQPVPVKLVAAANAPIQPKPMSRAPTTALQTQTSMPLQPAIQPPINQLQMPSLTPIPQSSLSNSAFRNQQLMNTNTHIQINPVNKENSSNLSRNEILIELNQTADGNRLVVHGPPLAVSYSLNMTEVTAFIREVMAFPLLHNKSTTQTSRVQTYWVFIATKFNMPAHIAKAVWNFLSENFQHFPKISPLDVLMAAPFQTEAQAWQQGTDCFQKFYENCVKRGWTVFEDKLPTLMQKIGEEKPLYQDLLRNRDASTPFNTLQLQTTWNNLRSYFGIHCIDEIWNAFKSAFWQYMQEIECGFENHWPYQLWRTFAKMEFLIHQRYDVREPFFYIVRNKFQEEIGRCQALEANVQKQREVQHQSVGAESSLPASDKPYEIDAYNLMAAIRRNSQIYLASNAAVKEEAWKKVAQELNASVPACRLSFQRALKNYRIYMARDPPKRCRLNQRYYKNMHEIYRAVTTAQKINIKTPHELNQSVGDGNDPNDIVFPERMILDINMDNSDARLVMKNWMYGIGNCSSSAQAKLADKLQILFSKYEKFTSK